jgi:glycine/D-amino acid oxidase-like deaminating enzyme
MEHLNTQATSRADETGFASLWSATAVPGIAFPSLSGDAQADVAVVGAGYTGLSAALHLAERGISVIVLEAHEPGWGASGRNGGQVIPGLKYDPPELLAMFGSDLGQRMIDFVGQAPELVFQLIQRHGIDCDARRCGWIQPAHNTAMEPVLRRRAESWAAQGADVEILDRARTAEYIGTEIYRSAWLDKRGGALNPLSYARGLARSAQAAGARIHSSTPVGHLQAKGGAGFELKTAHGTVSARQVILATNGYTDGLWPGLRQSIIPAHSFQVATAPLADRVRRTILPYGQVCSDSRRLLLYFRIDSGGRLVMGGVGTFGAPRSTEVFQHLVRAVRHLFPQVDATYNFHWYGRVAMTMDHLPHLHEPAPGLLTALGYNGRGVAMATALGSLLARRASGEAPASIPMPVTPIRRIPLHPLRRVYVGAVRTYYRIRDVAA